MMRKDVKLGLGIGGIFLAVMIVYLLAVSADSTTPETVVLENPPAVTPERTTPAPAVTETRPEPSREPIIAANTNTGANNLAPTAEPATQPTPSIVQPRVEESTPVASGPDKWAVFLSNGMPMTTQTPDPKPAEPGGAEITSRTPVNPLRPLVPPTSRPADTSVVPSNSGPRTHVIKQGENFSSIAAVVYGNASYYSHLIRANPNIDPRMLKPGMTINIPPVDQVRADQPAARTAQPVAVDAKTEYRVETGDNLYKISMKLYGKPDRVDKLYELNKTTIGPRKDAVQVGMVLKLPEAPTSSR